MIELVRYLWPRQRADVCLVLATAVLSAVAAPASALVVGQVIGRLPRVVASDGIGHFGWLVAALVALLMLGSAAPVLLSSTSFRLTMRSEPHLGTSLVEPLLAPTGVAHLDDPMVRDVKTAADSGGYGVWQAVLALGPLIAGRLTTLLLACTVAAAYKWWAAGAMLAATWGVECYRNRTAAREHGLRVTQAEGSRRADYVFSLGMGRAAKELRVFGLGPWLIGRFVHEWHSALAPVVRQRRRDAVLAALVLAVHVAVLVVLLFLVGRDAANGRISLTVAATAVPALLELAHRHSGTQAAQMRHGVGALRATLRLPAVIAARHPEPAGTAHLATTGRPPEVRFERVRFRYPGTDRDVLHDLDLTLGSGEALALVGLNGAGKSTLTKLLAGVLMPTSGRVRVDGVDLASLRPDELRRWQRRVAPIVQQFARLPLSARENVELGAPDADGVDVEQIARESGAADIVAGLPHGWETVLDTSFEDGTDLSGGQWQRVALTRALYAVAAGAGVLVLDEPAAALDVRAEADLVQRYLSLTRGVSSLIISHRFSVVRDAHRIALLEDGRIAESGTHEELMAVGGRYAAMFGAQASRYAQGVI